MKVEPQTPAMGSYVRLLFLRRLARGGVAAMDEHVQPEPFYAGLSGHFMRVWEVPAGGLEASRWIQGPLWFGGFLDWDGRWEFVGDA